MVRTKNAKQQLIHEHTKRIMENQRNAKGRRRRQQKQHANKEQRRHQNAAE